MTSKTKLLFIGTLLIAGCNSKQADTTAKTGDIASVQTNEVTTTRLVKTYDDGSYCATVEFYNPNTMWRNTYTLSVEVEDNELARINWPNGGWLDKSHYNLEPFDEDGKVSFTSDAGYKYSVKLNEEGPCGGGYERSSTQAFEMNEAMHPGEEEGYVVWSERGCKYVVIDIDGWYVVADKNWGAYGLGRGDKVRGDLASFGSHKFYNISSSEEQEVYVNNYYATKSRAREKAMEKCGIQTNE